MAQTSYNYSTSKGVPGGIFDIAPYEINSFRNEANNGVLKFGMGAVTGTAAGSTIKVPAATTDKFEGVVVNGLTTEHDIDGNVVIRKDATVGVMRWGRVWVRVADGVTVAAGERAYLIASGASAGLFTNASSGTIDVKAKFIAAADNGIAPVLIANEV